MCQKCIPPSSSYMTEIQQLKKNIYAVETNGRYVLSVLIILIIKRSVIDDTKLPSKNVDVIFLLKHLLFAINCFRRLAL